MNKHPHCDDILVGEIFLETPQASAALAQIEELRVHGQRGAMASYCQLMIGPTRVGKSCIIKRYLANFPAEETQNGLRQEVVYVEAPNRCSTKAVAEAVLTALQDPKPSSGTEAELRGRILTQLRGQETKLLIVDEIHHVLRQAAKNAFEAANFFKSLLNQAQCPILFAGTPDALPLVNQNPQLRGRARGTILLKPYNWFEPADRRTFRRCLLELEKRFPAHIVSCDIACESNAAKLHYASGGVLGELVTLLRETIIAADRERLPAISLELLGEVYEALALGMDHPRTRINPFKMGVPERWSPRAMEHGTKAFSHRKGARGLAA